MSKHKDDRNQCENCAGFFTRLFQSYADGSWLCATDTLALDPYMSAEQRKGVERWQRKEQGAGRRAEQARRNFGIKNAEEVTANA